jgi:hypothetical protein
MRKRLLLISLFINVVAFAPSQVNIDNFALQTAGRLNTIFTSLRITGDLSAQIQPPNQLSGQILEGTATPTFTQDLEKKNPAPTRTPRPTSTPVPVPPAANPNATSLMILFGLIAVIVVIVGVWLNRTENRSQ